MQKNRRRAVALLASAGIGTLVSLTTALALVPRIRAVEVVAVFGGAFGAGAALVSAIVEFRASSNSWPESQRP
jgi:hypothetical protein